LFSTPAGGDVQQNYKEIAENFYLQNEKKPLKLQFVVQVRVNVLTSLQATQVLNFFEQINTYWVHRRMWETWASSSSSLWSALQSNCLPSPNFQSVSSVRVSRVEIIFSEFVKFEASSIGRPPTCTWLSPKTHTTFPSLFPYNPIHPLPFPTLTTTSSTTWSLPFYKTILLPSKHLPPPPLGENRPHPLNSPHPITLSPTYPKKIFLNSWASKPYSLQICFLFHNCNLLPSLRTSKNFVLFFPHTPPQSPLSIYISLFYTVSDSFINKKRRRSNRKFSKFCELLHLCLHPWWIGGYG